MTPASNVSAAQTRGVKTLFPRGKRRLTPTPPVAGRGQQRGLAPYPPSARPLDGRAPRRLGPLMAQKRRPPFGGLERPSNKKSANESSEVAVEECSRRGTRSAHEAAAHSPAWGRVPFSAANTDHLGHASSRRTPRGRAHRPRTRLSPPVCPPLFGRPAEAFRGFF